MRGIAARGRRWPAPGVALVAAWLVPALATSSSGRCSSSFRAGRSSPGCGRGSRPPGAWAWRSSCRWRSPPTSSTGSRSRPGGYRRETIFRSRRSWPLPIPIAVLRGRRRRVHGQACRRRWHALRRDGVRLRRRRRLPPLRRAGAADRACGTRRRTGIAAGGSNWSDLGVHLSIAQSLNAGNFPPQVPYFAGEPLVYHWFADFHAAIAAQAAGLFAVPAFVVSSAILAGALALLVHGLARPLLRGRGARRAAVLAVVLVVFGGGLGWMRLVGDLATATATRSRWSTEQLVRQLLVRLPAERRGRTSASRR